MIHFEDGHSFHDRDPHSHNPENDHVVRLTGLLLRHKVQTATSWPVILAGGVGSGKTHSLKSAAAKANLACRSINLTRHGSSISAIEAAIAMAEPVNGDLIHFFGLPALYYDPVISFLAEPGELEIIKNGKGTLLQLNTLQFALELSGHLTEALKDHLDLAWGHRYSVVTTTELESEAVLSILLGSSSPLIDLEKRLRSIGFAATFAPDFLEELSRLDGIKSIGFRAVERALYDFEQNLYGQIYASQTSPIE